MQVICQYIFDKSSNYFEFMLLIIQYSVIYSNCLFIMNNSVYFFCHSIRPHNSSIISVTNFDTFHFRASNSPFKLTEFSSLNVQKRNRNFAFRFLKFINIFNQSRGYLSVSFLMIALASSFFSPLFLITIAIASAI